MVFISVFFLLIILSLEEEKLIFLLTLFRHGARAPTKYYNESLYLDYLFEKWENPGELTPTGRRMHYALGLRNREKYINQKHFLSEKFDPHEILIYSTSYNRTLESAASQLQGLYPFNTGGEITEKQKRHSLPPINISSNIKSELDKLNNNALPFKMSLLPIRMINDKERKIGIDYLEGCRKTTDKIISKNTKNSVELKNLLKKFKETYSQVLNKIYGTEMKYDQIFIERFCDSFISGITEAKKMEKFKDLNKEELLNICLNFNTINYRDITGGGEERTIAILEVSKLLLYETKN